MNVEYNAEFGDTLSVTKMGPYTSSSWVHITVIDPSKVTGHDYRIDPKYDADSSTVVWDLTDVTTGQVVLADQTSISGEMSVIIDGIQPVVKIVTPANYGWDDTKGGYGNGFGYSGIRPITGVNWGGHSFFGGGDLGENFWGPNDVEPGDYGNIKIDFWNAASNTADPVAHPWSNCQTFLRPGYAANGVGVFPGAAYMMEPPDNPVLRRLNIQFVESDLVDHFWNPIAADAGDGYGGYEYVFIVNSDYVEDPTTLYSDGDLNRDCLVTFWPTGRGGAYTAEEEFTMYFYMIHPIKMGQTYWTFSTDGYGKIQSDTIAKARLKDLNVFPNPYFGGSAESSVGLTCITFNNLPADECTLRIFSLDGQLVRTIPHDNGTPLEQWDLYNSNGYPVSSGMYLAHITTAWGSRILKLAVIMPRGFGF